MAQPDEQGFMDRMGKEIVEMPGQVGEFAKKVPAMIGTLPGRMAGGVSRIARADPFGVSGQSNDRKMYWSAALSDLGGVVGGRGDKGMRFDVNQQQQMMKQRMLEQQKLDKYRQQMAQAALMNAKKPKGSLWTPQMKNAMAMGLKPGSPEFTEMVRKLSMKPAMQFNMGPKVGTAFYGDVAKGMGAGYEEALRSQQKLASYAAMETVLPFMGETGVGKEMMTSFQSGLKQFGLGHLSNFIDAVGEASGMDFFSGDLGANELFRALGTGDIIGQASELYPVSDRDMGLLKEMVATLRINDKDTMKVLINRGKEQAQIPISVYNTNRQYMENAPEDIRSVLPKFQALPETPYLDVDSLIPSDRTGMSDDEYEQRMEGVFGPDWRDTP